MNNIIEFFGLPGSGKSTLAQNLAIELEKNNVSYYNIVYNVSHKSKVYKIFCKYFILLKELLKSPHKFFKQISIIYNTRQKNLKDLIKVIVNWFFITNIIKENIANKDREGYVILDQGVIQAIWSINFNSDREVDYHEILKYTDIPDYMVIVNANEENINKRLLARTGEQSRFENYAGQKMDLVFNKARDGFLNIKNYLINGDHSKDYNIISIENNNLVQMKENVKKLRIWFEENNSKDVEKN
jgi:thymidylate kinase